MLTSQSMKDNASSKHPDIIPGTCPGRADVCASLCGKFVYIGGSDALIKKISVETEEEVGEPFLVVVDDEELEVTSLDKHPQKANILAVGTNAGTASILDFEKRENTLLTRSVGVIREVSFSNKGQILAIATSEHYIRLVDLQNPGKTQDIRGHEGPIKSVSWGPFGKYLASTSYDGSLKVWEFSSLNSNGFKLQKTFRNIFPKESEDLIENSVVWKPSWHPSGKYLALPGSKDVQIVRKEDWKEVTVLKTGKTAEIHFTLWSPNGLYLLTFTVDNSAYAWDMSTSECQREMNFEEKQQAVKWLNTSRGIVSLSVSGDFWILDEFIPLNKSSPCAALERTEQGFLAEKFSETNISENQTSVNEAEKEEITNSLPARDSENVTGEVGDDVISTSLDKIKAQLGFKKSVNESEEAREESEAHEKESKRISDQMLGPRADMTYASSKKDFNFEELHSLIQRQPAFQPASTPSNTNGMRILIWNSVGVITSRREDRFSSVEIEFADMKFHRNIRFTDHYGLEMGSLSTLGALFASSTFDSESFKSRKDVYDLKEKVENNESSTPVKSILAEAMKKAEMNDVRGIAEDTADEKDDLASRSVLYFREFNSFISNAEWTLHLPKNEIAVSVSCGGTFCAAATNMRLLRILRADGTQEVPILLPGPVVGMTSVSNLLFIVYHGFESALNNTQHMWYLFYEICHQGSDNAVNRIAQGELPLPLYEKEPLQWIGLSDESMGYMPVFFDVQGVLYGLTAYNNWSWVPLLNTKRVDVRKSKHENFWPVCVSSKKVMAVVLKEKGEIFPKVLPRPILSSFDIQLPMIALEKHRVGSLKYKLEEEALLSNLLWGQKRWFYDMNDTIEEEEAEAELEELSKSIDAQILKHFVLCLKLKKLNRAIGLVFRLRTVEAIRIAHVQATKEAAGAAIIEKIEEILETRIVEQENATNDFEDGSLQYNKSNREDEEEQDFKPAVVSKMNAITKKTMAYSPASKPVNPFAKTSPALQEISTGLQSPNRKPSLVITPKLGRQSSFSQEARSSTKRRKIT